MKRDAEIKEAQLKARERKLVELEQLANARSLEGESAKTEAERSIRAMQRKTVVMAQREKVLADLCWPCPRCAMAYREGGGGGEG